MESVDRQRGLERELIDTLDRKVRAQERLMAMKDATIAELELRVSAQEQTSYDGTLLWRVPDFTRKRQDAVSGRVTSIYSPAFFTSRTGKLLLLLHPFNGLFSGTTWVSRYQKGKTSLDLNEARDYGDGSSISWTICTSFQTLAPHHSIFYALHALPDAQPIVSKYEGIWQVIIIII